MRALLSCLFLCLLTNVGWVQHPSVCIVGADYGNEGRRGSGVIVANDAETQTVLVMTARHVIEGNGRIWCNPPGTGKRFYATSVQRNPDYDVAIFAVPRAGLEDRQPMQLWTGELKPGTPVYSEGFGNVKGWSTQAIGNPLWVKNGHAFARLRGSVLPSSYVNPGIMQFDLPSIPGDSGSPIFTVYQGQPFLVGITSTSNWENAHGVRQVPTRTVAPHVGPIRQWIATLGWRVRRAGSQAQQYTYGTELNAAGCIVFGRRTIFGRSHPAPYNGPQCLPGQGCLPQQAFPPQQSIPRLEEIQPAPPEIVPSLPQSQPAPRPSLLDQFRQHEQQYHQDQGTYTLPGRLETKFDTTKLKAELLAEMANDPRFRGRDGRDGERGPQGARGEAGASGPPGRDGTDGRSATVDEASIARRVAGMIDIPQGLSRSDVEQIALSVMDGYQAQIPIDQIVDAVVARLPSTPVATEDPDTGERTDLGTLVLGETFVIPFRRGSQSIPSEIGRGRSRHMVLIADKNASYWPAMSQSVDRARGYYSGIRVAEPPDFAVELPQVVGYRDGLPIKVLAVGQREVSALLSQIASNQFEEDW